MVTKLVMGLFFLLVQVFAFAQTSQEESMWVEALRPFYNQAQKDGINMGIAVLKDQEDGKSPAFMAFKPAEKQCLFVVGVEGNTAAKKIFELAPKIPRDVVLKTIWAHEFAHCLQHLRDPSLATRPELQIGGHMPVRELEVPADAYAVAWFVKHDRSNALKAQRFLNALRKQEIGTAYDSDEFVELVMQSAQSAPDPALENIFDFVQKFKLKQ